MNFEHRYAGMRNLFLSLAVLLAFTSVHAADPGPRKGQRITVLNKTLMLQLVNEARKSGFKCGETYYNPAPPLSWNNLLEAAAAGHAGEMYDKNYFSHTATDGSRAGERMERAGYNWKMFGENIGMGYKNEREVVAGWLNSPGHCKNIMNKDFKEIGVGRAGSYWTQNFGTR